MKAFLISYDLGSPEGYSDYQKITTYVEETFSERIKPLQSQWLVASNDKKVGSIRDDLKKITDPNDKILVIDVTNSSWATARMGKAVNEWLNSNL